MDPTTIERRLRQLEDLEAIRTLKYRYFACCDGKDPKGMRACFVDGPCAIDYGVVGKFADADALVRLYAEVACHEHMVEMHHGANPQLEIIGADTARGSWGVQYLLINTRDNTLTHLSGYYEDQYRRTAAGWRIAATTFRNGSTLVLNHAEGPLQKLFAGRAPPVG